MNEIVFAKEAVIGRYYRLNSNYSRSSSIVVQFIGMSPKGHPLFLYDDIVSKTTLLINSVLANEIIEPVGLSVLS